MRMNLANEVQGTCFRIDKFHYSDGLYFCIYIVGVISDYIFEPFMSGDSFGHANRKNNWRVGEGRGIALLILIFQA